MFTFRFNYLFFYEITPQTLRTGSSFNFQVMLIESTDKGRVYLGVVDSSYNHGLAPGLGGSVGFNTDLKMFDNEKQTPSGGKHVTGKKSFSSH